MQGIGSGARVAATAAAPDPSHDGAPGASPGRSCHEAPHLTVTVAFAKGGGELHADGEVLLLRRSLERVLALADLTIGLIRSGLRRELLRWRDLVAEIYVSEGVLPADFQAVFHTLLLFTPAAATQIPHVLPLNVR